MQTTGVHNPQIHKMPRSFVRPNLLKEQELPPKGGFIAWNYSPYMTASRRLKYTPELQTRGVNPESLINTRVTLDYVRRDPSNTIPRGIVIFKSFGVTAGGAWGTGEERPCILYLPLNSKNNRHRILTLSNVHPVVVTPVQEPFLGMSI